MTIPRTVSTGLQLNGRQSKVVLTDYTFGNTAHANKLLYSTATVLFAGAINAVDVVFLYGDADQSHEFALVSGSSKPSTFAFTPASFTRGLNIVAAPKTTSQPLVLFADTDTASTFFAPHVPSSDASTKFRNFFQFGTNDTVLVGGPQLVRNASVTGHTLALRGDLNASVPLTLLVPSSLSAVSWNGADVAVRPLPGAPALPNLNLLQADLTFGLDKATINVPTLTGWKFKDSLPEVQSAFDDASWVLADHTTTNITTKPAFGDGRVLYGASPPFIPSVCSRTLCRMRLWIVSLTSVLETGPDLGLAVKTSCSGADTFMPRARRRPST